MLKYSNYFECSGLDPQTLEKGFEAVRHEADSGEIGYYHLPRSSQLIVEELKTIYHDTDRRFNTIAIIGIGGSSLGIKAIERLLRPSTPNAKKLIYL